MYAKQASCLAYNTFSKRMGPMLLGLPSIAHKHKNLSKNMQDHHT